MHSRGRVPRRGRARVRHTTACAGRLSALWGARAQLVRRTVEDGFPGAVVRVHAVYDTSRLDPLAREFGQTRRRLADLLDEYTSRLRRRHAVKRRKVRTGALLLSPCVCTGACTGWSMKPVRHMACLAHVSALRSAHACAAPVLQQAGDIGSYMSHTSSQPCRIWLRRRSPSSASRTVPGAASAMAQSRPRRALDSLVSLRRSECRSAGVARRCVFWDV